MPNKAGSITPESGRRRARRPGARAFAVSVDGRALSARDINECAERLPAAPKGAIGASKTQASLAAREIEVLRWLAHDLSDEQVAQQLGISPTTASKYREHAGQDDVHRSICAPRCGLRPMAGDWRGMK